MALIDPHDAARPGEVAHVQSVAALPAGLRLAILASHPIQYYGPLYRELARRLDVEVFFAHRTTPQDQARAGYDVAFEWDVDPTAGYAHRYLANVSPQPGTGTFHGCDTPGIADALGAVRYDALLVHGWHLKAYIQGIVAAKRARRPVLVRGDSLLRAARLPLKSAVKALTYPALLRVFDAALYVGERSRDYYRHYHYPTERLFFSPHCVDTAWFAARATTAARERVRARIGVSSHTPLALFAGRLVDMKRPVDLVHAAARCRAQGLGVEILVAGDGALRPQLSAQAAQCRVPLHHLGFQNQSQMPDAYAACDCLVLPSDERETWGLVANEALACGRPIVVSQACGCGADLVPLGAGRRFLLGDIAQLAAAMADVLKAPPDGATLTAISQAYSLEAAADGICRGLGHVMRAR